MDNNNLLQIAQQGLRMTVGAATSLVETVQNPQKRTEILSQMQSDLSQKTQEWAAKGEVTEQEARVFLDSLFSKQDSSTNHQDMENAPVVSRKDTTSDLQNLTDDIISLRKELEEMRQSKN
ncbi:hypothetical protein Xen7305DRAFT_00020940 [Xenococcus sp. PCC 7305]|uniref:hypothetical protein n=1 Tax=Xenococcus sp. PCC 7305 TaxID=102125 RepID=UPI0002AD1676|nr:hypothetical protein [Xenococcus sp. PCC 7305]ELS02380.1 hypothetical protein Xen7305DRAFT_00020940 [Xenococcus sp. PCC 7305]